MATGTVYAQQSFRLEVMRSARDTGGELLELAATYGPGSKAPPVHYHPQQEETFVPISGTLTMYLGEPPERVQVPTGGMIHVEPGTELQTANHGDEELLIATLQVTVALL